MKTFSLPFIVTPPLKMISSVWMLVPMIWFSAAPPACAQKTPSVSDNQPLYYVDSTEIDHKNLDDVDPNDIALITIQKGAEAIAAAGKGGRNGIIYIFTQDYTRSQYWHFFSAQSPDYKEHVPAPDTPDVIYILNGKVLTGKYDGTLFSITPKDLTQLQVISKKQLKRTYKQSGKVGVVITTREQEVHIRG